MHGKAKIIALLPIKNEAWILPIYLSSMTKIADEIIALNDASIDESADILKKAGVIVVESTSKEKVNMSEKRRLLLQKGRDAGGTHFIWLDADELLSDSFMKKGRDIIASLRPAERLSMRWVTLWKDIRHERTDPPWGNLYKDFIVCDDPSLFFEERILSEGRTPISELSKNIMLEPKEGVVLHLQGARWNAYQMKQAWYRCIEYTTMKKSARRINLAYRITLNAPWVKTIPLPAEYACSGVQDIVFSDSDFHLKEIESLFEKYGIAYFEALDIWHIQKLRDQFIREVGHEPRPVAFPSWMIRLNGLRHRILK